MYLQSWALLLMKMFPDLTMRLAPVGRAKPIGQSGVILAALVHLLGDRLWLRIVPHPRTGACLRRSRTYTTCVCTVYCVHHELEHWEERNANWHARRRPIMKGSGLAPARTQRSYLFSRNLSFGYLYRF